MNTINQKIVIKKLEIMKRIFLLVAFIANISLVASAASISSNIQQDGKSKVKRCDYSSLNLSEKQQTEINNINKDFSNKLEQIKSDSMLSKKETMAKRKELKIEQKTKIDNILSTEQKTLLKEQREKRHKNLSSSKKEKRQKRGRAHINRKDIYKNLNLSEDQKSQLDKINEDYDKKLSSLKTEHDSAINNVLSLEQQATLKAEVSKDRKNKPNFKGCKAKGKRSDKKLDTATIQKLEVLKENYEKDKKAIQLSRIAPDIQKKQLEELDAKYKNERHNIMKEVRSNSSKEKQKA